MPCYGCHPLHQPPQGPIPPGLEQFHGKLCLQFQQSKFCTSLNTSPLKSFIILEILSSHQDLLETTTFLVCLLVFFFLCRVFRFTSLISQSFGWSTNRATCNHVTFSFQDKVTHLQALPGAVTQLCQEPRAPGTCQAKGNTCPHRSCHENKAWTCWKCKPGIFCQHRNQGDYRAGEVLAVLPGTAIGDF